MNRTLRKALSILTATVLVMTTTTSHAQTPWWAWGEVEFVQQTPGIFIIALASTAADGCQYDRIYLYETELGVETVNRAVSFALAAQASGRQVGIVIDLDKKQAGLRCNALGNMVMR